jgi:hypothetical protein
VTKYEYGYEGGINMAIITFLIIGWILSWFKFERVIIQAFKELFKKDITKATYYFLFLCLGVFGEMVLLFQGAYYEYFLHG